MKEPTKWQNEPVEATKGIHLLSDYGRKYCFLSQEISTSIIAAELNKLNWIECFYQFIVVKSPGISMEVGGNLNSTDGLSAMFTNHHIHTQAVIKRAPESIIEMKNILKAFIQSEDSWQKQYEFEFTDYLPIACEQGDIEKAVPDELKTDKNEEVLAFLKPLSCHSDIVEPLMNSLSDYSDVKSFCPNGRHYKYVFFYANKTLFAFAVGKQNIALRLPENQLKAAIAHGSSSCKNAGNHWFWFSYDTEKIHHWSKIAYEYAISP